MEAIFNKLWEATKLLSAITPYVYSSEYYAHLDAAQQLKKALPESEQENFEKFIREKIKGYSNYSGD